MAKHRLFGKGSSTDMNVFILDLKVWPSFTRTFPIYQVNIALLTEINYILK